jgi:hypothetical protein
MVFKLLYHESQYSLHLPIRWPHFAGEFQSAVKPDHLYSETTGLYSKTILYNLRQNLVPDVVASFTVELPECDHIEPSFHLGGDIADSAKGEGGPGLLPNLSLL